MSVTDSEAARTVSGTAAGTAPAALTPGSG